MPTPLQKEGASDGDRNPKPNIELGELQEHLDGLPREIPLITVCASGIRASMAGGILQRDGRDNVHVLPESGSKPSLSKSLVRPVNVSPFIGLSPAK